MSGFSRQKEGLEVSPAANGFMVRDPARDRVHYLNHTAVVVLELCTGENSAEAIAEFLRQAYSLPEAPLSHVRTYLDRLTEEGLVA